MSDFDQTVSEPTVGVLGPITVPADYLVEVYVNGVPTGVRVRGGDIVTASTAPASLDAALADTVAALPPGGAVELLGPLGGRWAAAVRGDPWMPGRSGGGDTPADALRALTAKLRER